MSDLKGNKNLATDYYRRGVGNMMHTFPILVIAVGKLGCIGSATSLQRGTLIETLKKMLTLARYSQLILNPES